MFFARLIETFRQGTSRARRRSPLASGPRRNRRGLRVERLEDRSLLAAVADLVAYRPVNPYLNYALHPVAEAVETDPALGPGIRVNGDDDNGNRRADYQDKTTAAAGDNDLVRVDARGAGTTFTVSWTGPLAVWTSSKKSAPVGQGAAINPNQSLWVEYASQTHSIGTSATLTLAVDDLATTTTASDQVVFHSFQSEVIVIGGNTQDPRRVGDPNLGIFTIGATLYDRGYDVQLFAHNQISSTGRGAAYNEVVNAVLKRNVDNVAILGYSWGGGATYELAAGLKSNAALATAGYKLQYTAYVDGIRHNSIVAETRLPVGTKFHDNFYQRNDFWLKGNAVAGANNVNVTTTDWGKSLTHTTVDDNATLQSLLVNSLATRIVA